MKNLAIIPARSGSKGLKDKNILPLLGKPLIAYSIETAIKSECFSRIHVSTDSKEYADISKKYGADVPFLRSDKLSGDTAGTWDVVREVLTQYKDIGEEFDTVTVLQPTSPLRIAEDIVAGFSLYNRKQAEAVIAVCEMEHSPLWSNCLPESNCMKGFLKDKYALNRQKLETYYRINGALYIVDVNLINHGDNIYNEKSFAYIMPQERSIDIDTKLDFIFAETIMLNMKQ